MSRLKARAVEAALGAGAGMGLGAVARRLTHRPKDPLEWSEADGSVHARSLTAEERAVRRQAVTQAALATAGVGAAATLGGSLYRRSVIARMERDAAKDLGDTYLAPLQEILQQYRADYHQVSNLPGGPTAHLSKQMHKRINVAATLLRQQEAAVNDLLDEAAKRRSAKPFGGVQWASRNSEKVPFAADSHPDLVRTHFNQLAKVQGLDQFTMSNRYDVYENAIHRGLHKTACVLELLAIHRGVR